MNQHSKALLPSFPFELALLFNTSSSSPQEGGVKKESSREKWSCLDFFVIILWSANLLKGYGGHVQRKVFEHSKQLALSLSWLTKSWKATTVGRWREKERNGNHVFVCPGRDAPGGGGGGGSSPASEAFSSAPRSVGDSRSIRHLCDVFDKEGRGRGPPADIPLTAGAAVASSLFVSSDARLSPPGRSLLKQGAPAHFSFSFFLSGIAPGLWCGSTFKQHFIQRRDAAPKPRVWKYFFKLVFWCSFLLLSTWRRIWHILLRSLVVSDWKGQILRAQSVLVGFCPVLKTNCPPTEQSCQWRFGFLNKLLTVVSENYFYTQIMQVIVMEWGMATY